MSQDDLDYEAFVRTIDRVRSGKDRDAANPRPEFDAKLADEIRRDRTEKRAIADYKTALEYFGWVYFTAHQLGPLWGERAPILRTEGQWRNMRHARELPSLRFAMTSNQICEWFPGGPKEFFEWYATKLRRARAAAAGIILPPDDLVVV